MILTRGFTPASNNCNPSICNTQYVFYTRFKVKIYSANRLKSPQKYCHRTKLYFFVGKSKHVLLNFRVVSERFLVKSDLSKLLSLTLNNRQKTINDLKKAGKCILRVFNVKILHKKSEVGIFLNHLGCKAHQFQCLLSAIQHLLQTF